MAAKAKPLPPDISKVRIPGTLFTRLDYLLNSLHHPIIAEAATFAFARKTGPAAGRVTADDIARAAQNILPSVVAGLAKSLTSRETRHDRRNAS